MDRKTFLKQTGLALAAASVAPGMLMAGNKKLSLLFDGDAKGKRPNIFIYVADDQYIGSVGCYGAEPSYTPNIDKLAASAVARGRRSPDRSHRPPRPLVQGA